MPKRAVMQGQSAVLEPLGLHHCDALWEQASAHPDSFNYLRYGPFANKNALHDVVSDLSSRADQPFWAVRLESGPTLGWLSICDIDTANGSIEIGSIWFSPTLQGTRAAREAIFMAMCHCMDDLGYERLVWRCQAENAKSMRAAQNLGFRHEGTWRNAAVVKGWQRGVAWFSILKSEWPGRRTALSEWLRAENFDDAGQQRSALRHD
ncbi:GNAT family N-acetyltransferase [Octadecabacter sp. G9-8]|uniref:GNAT family N-acetyltransferase n=1 Tax=Octadecabacter dasysiphoniae TaxID=2909341 RepID=A0ABS9CZC7_9RHOB|nr:GNAT family protein [Octadecabacter dasysiphoniae]MCF2871739.1 GNAT family N-acetyltransferase [Octadecabacter dasysiphoniae]